MNIKKKTLIRKLSFAKRSKAGQPFVPVRYWRSKHGYCETSRLGNGQFLAGVELRRVRGRCVREIIMRDTFDQLSSHIEPYSGPRGVVFHNFGDIAVAYVNGVAVIESCRIWQRRASRPQQRSRH